MVFNSPSIMSLGAYTTYIAAIQQPNWLGQPFCLNVILLLADFYTALYQIFLRFQCRKTNTLVICG